MASLAVGLLALIIVEITKKQVTPLGDNNVSHLKILLSKKN